MFERSWYQIPELYTGWTFGHFFTLICCKNCIICLKGPKIKEKEAGVGPFFFKKVLPEFVLAFLALVFASVQRNWRFSRVSLKIELLNRKWVKFSAGNLKSSKSIWSAKKIRVSPIFGLETQIFGFPRPSTITASALNRSLSPRNIRLTMIFAA